MQPESAGAHLATKLTTIRRQRKRQGKRGPMQPIWLLVWLSTFLNINRAMLSLAPLVRRARSTVLFGSTAYYSSKDENQVLVTIRASDVAAAVGLNPYRPPSEVLNEMWLRTNPETFHKNKKKTRQQEQEEALQKFTYKEKQAVFKAVKFKAKDAKDATVQLDKAVEVIEASSHPIEEKKQVIYPTYPIYTLHTIQHTLQHALHILHTLQHIHTLHTLHMV